MPKTQTEENKKHGDRLRPLIDRAAKGRRDEDDESERDEEELRGGDDADTAEDDEGRDAHR